MARPNRMAGGKTRKRAANIFNMPTYVINMNERKDRWKRFQEHQSIGAFKKLARFPAVNGKKLNYKRDRRISMGTRLNITRNYRRSHYEIATLGAIGSSMSHIGVWKRLVASGAPMCLVLEDDVVLNDIQLNSIPDMINSAPEGWGVWILGCYLPNLILQPYQGTKWSRVYNFTAAHAYIITREAAKIFLEEAFPIEMHIEYYMTTASIIREIPIVHNETVHLEFFRQVDGGPRTPESNTSQHKKSGCPTCNAPDDYSQLYRGFTRKTKNGMHIMGVVDGKQPDTILTYKKTAVRED